MRTPTRKGWKARATFSVAVDCASQRECQPRPPDVATPVCGSVRSAQWATATRRAYRNKVPKVIVISYCALTLLAWTLSQTIYVLLMAWVGRWLGLTIQNVEVGYGPTLWKGKLFGFPFRYALIPLGGFTRFGGRDGIRPTKVDDVDDGGLALEDAPWTRFLAIVLVGPSSSVAIGLMLLAAPIVLGGPRLMVGNDGKKVLPTALPNLIIDDAAPTANSQCDFFRASGFEFLTRIILLRQMSNWGGPVGFILTAGFVGKQSFSTWLTLVGSSILAAGLANLLPFPMLNGWHAFHAFVKGVSGREIPASVNGWLMLAGMLYLLVVLGARLVLLDVFWLWKLVAG